MKNLLCETAAVIHVGEGGVTTVALVDVEKGNATDTEEAGNRLHEDQHHH